MEYSRFHDFVQSNGFKLIACYPSGPMDSCCDYNNDIIIARIVKDRGLCGGGAGTGPVIVSRWGRPGLQAGDWVMKGKPNRLNYRLSFKWENHRFNQKAPFEAGEGFTVPANSVKLPDFRGFFDNPIWKGPFGQRIYDPSLVPSLPPNQLPWAISVTPVVVDQHKGGVQ